MLQGDLKRLDVHEERLRECGCGHALQDTLEAVRLGITGGRDIRGHQDTCGTDLEPDSAECLSGKDAEELSEVANERLAIECSDVSGDPHLQDNQRWR